MWWYRLHISISFDQWLQDCLLLTKITKGRVWFPKVPTWNAFPFWEQSLASFNLCCLLVMKSRIQFNTRWSMFKLWSFRTKMLWSIRSNAFLKKKITIRTVPTFVRDNPHTAPNCLWFNTLRMAGFTTSSTMKSSVILDKTAVNWIGRVRLRISLIGLDLI